MVQLPNLKWKSWLAILLLSIIAMKVWQMKEVLTTPVVRYAPVELKPTVAEPVKPQLTPEQTKFDTAIRASSHQFRHTDVNGDGLYNCIDAALIFQQYYPEAKLTYARSIPEGNAHLYIRIGERIVEPQHLNGDSDLVFPEGYRINWETERTVSTANAYKGVWSDY